MSLYKCKMQYTSPTGAQHKNTFWVSLEFEPDPPRSVAKVTTLDDFSDVDHFTYNVAGKMASFIGAGGTIGPCSIELAVISGKEIILEEQPDANWDPFNALGPESGSTADMPGWYTGFTGKGLTGGAWRQFLFGTFDYSANKGKVFPIPQNFVSSDPDRILFAMKAAYEGNSNAGVVTTPHANPGSTALVYSRVRVRGRARAGINRNLYRHNIV